MIITIDGPAGSGKSTIARQLAEKLGFFFLDTGAMYRCIAYALHRKKIALNDEHAIATQLKTFDLKIKNDRYFLEEEDITDAIRTPEISDLTSTISTLPVIRNHLVPLQRDLVSEKNAVAEGRDLGTVVFPNAELKIFLIASPEIRAQRRLKQQGGTIADPKALAATQAAIEKRDQTDSMRNHSPLKQADDAILIDTSYLSIKAIIEKIAALL